MNCFPVDSNKTIFNNTLDTRAGEFGQANYQELVQPLGFFIIELESDQTVTHPYVPLLGDSEPIPGTGRFGSPEDAWEVFC